MLVDLSFIYLFYEHLIKKAGKQKWNGFITFIILRTVHKGRTSFNAVHI